MQIINKLVNIHIRDWSFNDCNEWFLTKIVKKDSNYLYCDGEYNEHGIKIREYKCLISHKQIMEVIIV